MSGRPNPKPKPKPNPKAKRCQGEIDAVKNVDFQVKNLRRALDEQIAEKARRQENERDESLARDEV